MRKKKAILLKSKPYLLVITILIIGILILVLNVSKVIKFNDWTPERLSNIPQTAIWSGGPDGGFWFDFLIFEPENNHYRIKIYDDYSGELDFDATFEQRGDSIYNFSSIDSLASTINCWIMGQDVNGERYIVLTNGNDLYPISIYYSR